MPTVPVFLDDCLYAAHETRGMGRKQKVAVRVAGDKILVTLPGTNFNVTYERSSEGPGLVASAFGGRKDEDNKVKLPESSLAPGRQPTTKLGSSAGSNKMLGPAPPATGQSAL
jgi:hypothetical protein